MSTATVSLWASCIKALHQLTADPQNEAAVEAATQELFRLVDDAASKTNLPHAIVKKLVNDLQVGMLLAPALKLRTCRHHPAAGPVALNTWRNLCPRAHELHVVCIHAWMRCLL